MTDECTCAEALALALPGESAMQIGCPLHDEATKTNRLFEQWAAERKESAKMIADLLEALYETTNRVPDFGARDDDDRIIATRARARAMLREMSKA